MDTIKIGVAGLGRLGLIHAHNIAGMKGVELTAVSNLDNTVNQQTKEKYDISYTYTAYEDMIQNEELDAVCIVTPSGFHPDHIYKALRKNLHVFCEKPIGLDINEVRNMIPVIEQSNKVFHLGFMRRYDADYMYAKDMIDRGDIGEISIIRSYGLDPIEGLDSFVKYAAKNTSGGIFSDMSIHDIDIIRWYTGSEIKQVWAMGNNKAAPSLSELNEVDIGTATMKLENGAIAFVAAGRTANHGYHVETEVIGTEGMLRIAATPDKNKVTVFDNNGVIRPTSQNFAERFRESYVKEIEEFVRCIRNNDKPEVNAWDGLRSTEVAAACQTSLEEERLVEIQYER